MSPCIEPSARHPTLVAEVARWHFAEWGHAASSGSESEWAKQLASRAQVAGVPSYYLALANRVPIGFVGLCEDDMSTHPELHPWLTGLYVLPSFRHRGVGSLLVLHAMNAARAAGVRTLFLHTGGAKGLYARHGWKLLGREFYEGEGVCVTSAELTA